MHRMKKRNARQVQQFQANMREMQRRLQLLEDDNAQLRRRLVPHASDINATTTSCIGPFSSTQPLSSPIASHKRKATMSGDDGVAGDQAPTRSSRPLLHNGPGMSSEMYWCFPFLQRFNLSPSRFVVDDLQKAVMVILVRPGTKSIIFATHQFCTVSGFSMAELIGRELVSVVPRLDKPRFIRAWLTGTLEGLSDVVPCCFHIEHKHLGQLIKILARHQFFVDGQHTYSVTCIDQVLGMDFSPFPTKELSEREEQEWTEVSSAMVGGRDVRPSAAPSPTTTLHPTPIMPSLGQLSPPDEAWGDFLGFDIDHDNATSSPSPLAPDLFLPQ